MSNTHNVSSQVSNQIVQNQVYLKCLPDTIVTRHCAAEQTAKIEEGAVEEAWITSVSTIVGRSILGWMLSLMQQGSFIRVIWGLLMLGGTGADCCCC